MEDLSFFFHLQGYKYLKNVRTTGLVKLPGVSFDPVGKLKNSVL